MADVFWLVSHDSDANEHDDSVPCMTVVEFFESWPSAKRRYADLRSAGVDAELFDDDGELVRAREAEIGAMSVPRSAGVYAWHEVSGYQRVAPLGMPSWRLTPRTYNAIRLGAPPKEHGDPSSGG